MTHEFKRFIILGLGIYSIFVLYTRFDVYENTRYSFITQNIKAYEENISRPKQEVSKYPVSQPNSGSVSRQEIEREVDMVFGRFAGQAKKVIMCESSFRPRVISKTKDYGLFQISHIHGYRTDELLDWRSNIRIAHQIFVKKGWQPWYSSKKCHKLF